jgi:hypothetical protein
MLHVTGARGRRMVRIESGEAFGPGAWGTGTVFDYSGVFRQADPDRLRLADGAMARAAYAKPEQCRHPNHRPQV